jgi:hypothetical protein
MTEFSRLKLLANATNMAEGTSVGEGGLQSRRFENKERDNTIYCRKARIGGKFCWSRITLA